ncbi:salutaridine reductase-like [Pistacia vera]|uniref:salutaridine reductase-like n=1 Tax=Pistacia vera TaxID=55513 RepID=UPI00126319D4|nr:salutaridine reductase-like [Pistacia vera]
MDRFLIVLTARDAKRDNDAVEKLESFGLFDVVFHQLSVTFAASIASLATFIETNYGKLDILVNNAGVVGTQNNECKSSGGSFLGIFHCKGLRVRRARPAVY